MELPERLAEIRTTYGRNHYPGSGLRRCRCCDALERHLDLLQSEVEQLLARTDSTPASITLTAR